MLYIHTILLLIQISMSSNISLVQVISILVSVSSCRKLFVSNSNCRIAWFFLKSKTPAFYFPHRPCLHLFLSFRFYKFIDNYLIYWTTCCLLGIAMSETNKEQLLEMLNLISYSVVGCPFEIQVLEKLECGYHR